MLTSAVKINEMLNELEEEDCTAAISYIEFLSAKRKEKKYKDDQAILKEIQGMFADDKGWKSEEEMLEDMADFRRGRLTI
ncbi:MAG: hypothetical protein LIO80_08965 [Lachnospiraceae bacterium]|nr:hypothetical protein [Lachnospiraceae bacterium]